MKSFISIDKQIEEIQEIGKSKGLTLYSILFRNAGVGILWFDESRAGAPPIPPERDEDTPADLFAAEMQEYTFKQSEWIKKGLFVDQYYPSLSEALEGEKSRLGFTYRPGMEIRKPGPIDPSGIG